jgi:putative sterol carrier protein
MSLFKSSDDVYEFLGGIFKVALKDQDFRAAASNTGLIVRLNYSEPASEILVDFGTGEVSYGSDLPADADPDVTLYMRADDANQFWRGDLKFPVAMAKRKVKVEGSIGRAMKLLPLTEPLFSSYRSLLEEAGRSDLLGLSVPSDGVESDL